MQRNSLRRQKMRGEIKRRRDDPPEKSHGRPPCFLQNFPQFGRIKKDRRVPSSYGGSFRNSPKSAREGGRYIPGVRVDGMRKRESPSLCILSGEIGGTKNSAENLFSLPICVIMGLTKSLPPRGRWHGVAVTEGARVTLGLC